MLFCSKFTTVSLLNTAVHMLAGSIAKRNEFEVHVIVLKSIAFMKSSSPTMYGPYCSVLVPKFDATVSLLAFEVYFLRMSYFKASLCIPLPTILCRCCK
jgi:hypothetical protein